MSLHSNSQSSSSRYYFGGTSKWYPSEPMKDQLKDRLWTACNEVVMLTSGQSTAVELSLLSESSVSSVFCFLGTHDCIKFHAAGQTILK